MKAMRSCIAASKHMTASSLDRLLSQLEEAKRDFSPRGRARIEKLLTQLARKKFPDADSLIRFHEALLFLRAYPQSPELLQIAEEILSSFAERVEQLCSTSDESASADLASFDYIEYSGIAGTAIYGTFSYAIVCWLVEKYPERVSIDWASYEKKERMGATWPRFLPLLEEESLVEANIPYHSWISAATGQGEREISFLIRRFERLPVSHRERSELYDSLELRVRWELGDSPVSRTHLKRRVRKIFYHEGPLIPRKDVSLRGEFGSPPFALKKLSRRQGETILDMVRATTTVRYRELYGITNGDPESVMEAIIGRGVTVFLWGLPPERRLPLRAYTAGFTLKNGVPINYIEGISLFERVEVGFNTFYTFREGESAWVYARVLKLLNQALGVTCVSIDPYQLGFNNEEAIESGAFWFYRKLGFRPVRPEIAKLTEAEERKLASNKEYRTPVGTLKRLSKGHMVFEAPGTIRGDWDRFQTRNPALTVQRRMAQEFGGDSSKIRTASMAEVARAIDLKVDKWKESEKRAFENLSLVLALIPDIDSWTNTEKSSLARIIRAKAGADESLYLRLLQKHARLRDSMLKLGSHDPPSFGKTP